MNQSATPTVSRESTVAAPGFGHRLGIAIDAEKLQCHHVAREMRALVVGVLPVVSRVVHDQLDRASLSVVLNTAEGAGRRAPREKAHFYSIARGSANETAALLDLAAVERAECAGAVRAGSVRTTRTANGAGEQRCWSITITRTFTITVEPAVVDVIVPSDRDGRMGRSFGPGPRWRPSG